MVDVAPPTPLAARAEAYFRRLQDEIIGRFEQLEGGERFERKPWAKPAGESLQAALALAETIAKGPALALSLIRAGVRDSLNQETEEAIRRTLADSDRVFKGPDLEEGLAAFFGKRPPVFTATRGAAANDKEGK